MTDAGADIEILIGKIHKIKVNLKKALHRRYLKYTLDEKLRTVKSLYNIHS